MNDAINLAQRIATRLAQVEGVEAVVLGGSWARAAAGPDSDIDLGIYYCHDRTPSIHSLHHLAQELDDRHTTHLLTSFGIWLQIEGRAGTRSNAAERAALHPLTTRFTTCREWKG